MIGAELTRAIRQAGLCALMLAGFAALPQAARAQSAPVLTVPEIRSCICQEQRISSLRNVTAQKDADYKSRQAQSKDLSTQIDKMRATMDPTDTMAQDQLSELIDLRARVQQQIRETALPALQQATNALNAQVQSYNAACANRTIYDSDDVTAHQNLVCPAP